MTTKAAADILESLARSRGTMADAMTEISAGELAIVVAQVIAVLDGRGVATTDCLSFACGNDLPSAAVLLALLASDRPFLILPRKASLIDRDVGERAPATFCRYRLDIQRQQDASGAIVPALPDISIAVSQNPSWRGDLQAGPACFFVPTSGSTGRAKLVRHRHDRLLRAAGHCVERLGLGPSDRIALPVPIAHMFGLGAAFLPGILAGASLDLQSNANALRYLERERRFDPTAAFLTPAFGDALTRVRKVRRPYRLTVMAGDRLPTDLFDRYERLHGCLVNLYGSTELGVIAAGHPGDPPHRRRDVIGRPMPGVVIRNEDPAIADVLWFRHEDGFDCYTDTDGHALREPNGSRASGACFRSNDIGQLIDGYLSVHGRADDLVNRDGLLVACDDVAAALRGIPGIEEAVILGGEMTRRGRALIAFCVPATDALLDGAALRKACLRVLPSRAIPDEFVFLTDLPRLPSGKVDRVGLQASASF